jgi:hypothetical protein
MSWADQALDSNQDASGAGPDDPAVPCPLDPTWTTLVEAEGPPDWEVEVEVSEESYDDD